VKSLATQTARTTEEIGSQIGAMQSATRESVGPIEEIGGTIDRISTIAAAIAASVEQQGAATTEIARNVQQAAAGSSQVAANITDVNRGASQANRFGLGPGPRIGAVAGAREQPSQGRSREIPADRARGLIAAHGDCLIEAASARFTLDDSVPEHRAARRSRLAGAGVRRA
jgi:hypothetical protein